ncbi:MAG: putative sulfate exporter family transporter [Zetaproteobacteria bacterium]|nr:MAG: putative sulfate exporter family transporter [Zetaproteobacteria bacterium]
MKNNENHLAFNLWRNIKSILPGLMACVFVALSATFIAQHYNAPAMLLCLLFGISLNFMSNKKSTQQGIDFTAITLLRAGIVLIGARIMMSDFIALGGEMVALVFFTTISVVILGLVFAKALGLDREQGFLIGGATAICGASAALAISAILPRTKTLEQNTLLSIIGVTLMGTFAMIMYPALIGYFNFNDQQAGILIGGAIHDVSQVVGAGYSISEDAGDMAMLVKLMRVFLLVPLLLIFVFGIGKKKEEDQATHFPFPIFLIGFVVMMLLNSFHFIPEDIASILKDTSKWFLIMAISAVGIKTSPKALLDLGWKSIFLICGETIFIFVIYLTFILMQSNA